MEDVAVAPRTPKVLLRKNALTAPAHLPNPSSLELVLTEMGKGTTMERRMMFRRHCTRPETMTKVTIWSLYQLGLRLRADGANYNRLKIDEIRRLLSLAPQNIKRQLALRDAI